MSVQTSRRSFVKQSSLLLAAAATARLNWFKGYTPKLAFSTLGCPDWSLQKIMEFAAANGFSGIELRGVMRQMDLTQVPAFSNAAAIEQTLGAIKAHKLNFVNLGSSCTLHFPPGAERDKQLDEGKRFIELAGMLECPYIRVFPNNFIKDQSREKTLELIANGLNTLGVFAKGSGVQVLMETHGDLVKLEDLSALMNQVVESNVGLVWDPCNMWVATKVEPAAVYPALKKYIRHTHIKDARMVNGQPQYAFLGEGEMPILQAVDLLAKDQFKGYYSFEWEKLWHPEIAEPEPAFTAYSKTLRQHFSMK